MRRTARQTGPVLLLAKLLIGALLLAALAGCRREPEAADEPADVAAAKTMAPLPETFDGAWQGVLPCTDCDGVEVELALRRAPAEPARFELAERYLVDRDEGEFPTEFTSAGEWREAECALGDIDGWCVELVDVAQRWFRHEDGSLQAVDAEGRALDPDGARLIRL